MSQNQYNPFRIIYLKNFGYPQHQINKPILKSLWFRTKISLKILVINAIEDANFVTLSAIKNTTLNSASAKLPVKNFAFQIKNKKLITNNCKTCKRKINKNNINYHVQ